MTFITLNGYHKLSIAKCCNVYMNQGELKKNTKPFIVKIFGIHRLYINNDLGESPWLVSDNTSSQKACLLKTTLSILQNTSHVKLKKGSLT